MSNKIQWLVRPPSMAVGALCLIFLSPVSETPRSSPRTLPCSASAGRVAVAALGESPNAEISAFAGRSPYFLLFQASDLVEVVPNEYAAAERGAGAHAAYRLSELQVECLVAGAVGPRMRGVLAAEGISFFPTEGQAALTVSELVEHDGSEFQ